MPIIMGWIAWALGLLVLGASQAWSAAPPPAAPAGAIVVSARRLTVDAELRQVRRITAPVQGQVVRLEAPICPAVYGLPRAQSEAVEARMLTDADALGLALAALRCDPNLSVFVASGGGRFVTGLFERNPRLFDDLELHARERLLASKGPVWAWKLTSAHRRDGGPVQMVSSLQFSASEPLRPVARGAYLATDVEHGRLISPVRRDVDASFVVVDAAQVDGLTLQQIADFAVFAGLAPVDTNRADAAAGAPSILTLFADRARGRAGEAELTAFDRAYLSGLYAGGTGYSYAQKTLQIAIRLKTAPTTRKPR